MKSVAMVNILLLLLRVSNSIGDYSVLLQYTSSVSPEESLFYY